LNDILEEAVPMRWIVGSVVALIALVFAPPVSASASASIAPTSVDFGRVPFEGGCMIVADVPNEKCVSRTVTVTNTGSEPLEGVGFRSCETYIPESNSCFTVHADWGGFTTGADPRTCIFGVVLPGETCTVVLVAFPSRKGQIRGSFVAEMWSRESNTTTILVVTVRLLAVPAKVS
jgi:hypothetical protein